MIKSNKSNEFKMTHQAPAKRWSLYACVVSVVTRILFSGHQPLAFQHVFVFRTDVRTYVRTLRVKIMTNFPAVAWWVKKRLFFHGRKSMGDKWPKANLIIECPGEMSSLYLQRKHRKSLRKMPNFFPWKVLFFLTLIRKTYRKVIAIVPLILVCISFTFSLFFTKFLKQQ